MITAKKREKSCKAPSLPVPAVSLQWELSEAQDQSVKQTCAFWARLGLLGGFQEHPHRQQQYPCLHSSKELWDPVRYHPTGPGRHSYLLPFVFWAGCCSKIRGIHRKRLQWTGAGQGKVALGLQPRMPNSIQILPRTTGVSPSQGLFHSWLWSPALLSTPTGSLTPVPPPQEGGGRQGEGAPEGRRLGWWQGLR